MRRTALVLLFVASACSEPGVQQSIVSGDPGPEREQISLAVFGEDVDPDLVLATVDDRPVLAGQLAPLLLGVGHEAIVPEDQLRRLLVEHVHVPAKPSQVPGQLLDLCTHVFEPDSLPHH